MIKTQTIKQLYPLALAEGEGVGTAYEYYAKRLVLLPWLLRGERPHTMLVAGLPERYGSSLDFMLLGAELGCQVIAVDDRHAALAKLSRTLETLANSSYAPKLTPSLLQTNNLATMPELHGSFDLVVSSEVLQRLSDTERATYGRRVQELAPWGALFAPNAGNQSHVGLSGLRGVTLEEMNNLAGQNPQFWSRSGYIDIPPFPPGITRSESQREEASSGNLEAFAMWGLGYYARMEKFFPISARRKWAHIVFGLYDRRRR